MSLYLPPSLIEDSGFQWPEAPRSCSAPMALVVQKDFLPSTYLTKRNEKGGEAKAFTGGGSSGESMKALSIKSAPGSPNRAKLMMGFESNLLKDLSPFHFDEALSNDQNFGKNLDITPSSSFTKDTSLHPTIKKPLNSISKDQGELVSHSPALSKRLSSRCLKAFRKLRPPPPPSPEYPILNDCDINGTETEAINTFDSYTLSPPVSQRASIDLKKTKGNYKPPNVTEEIEDLTGPGNCVNNPLRVCSSATVVVSNRDESLKQEAKVIKQKEQLSLLKVAGGSPPESLESRSKDHAIVELLGKPPPAALSEVSVAAKEFRGDSTRNKVIDKTGTSRAEQIDTPQSNIDEMLESIYQENRKNLEKIGAESIHQEADICTEFMKKDEFYDPPKRDLDEKTPRKSRLATWRQKAKIENWLGRKKGISRHLSEKINSEPPRLRKSPSLLFRLWNPTVDSDSEGRQQKQDISHPLDEVITARAGKSREQILCDAGQSRFDDITNKRKRSNVSRALSQIFRENEPKVEDFSLEPPSVSLERQGAVNWNGSIQEYAGSLGQVCPSGERSVSDIFRTRETKPPSLKLQMDLGAELSFENSSLADDWNVAMRAMEEVSSAELKLKRTGAVKHKRTKKGDKNSKSNADRRKDGIGRSFSHEGGLSVGGGGAANVVHDDSDSGASIMSPFTSRESLYKFLEFS